VKSPRLAAILRHSSTEEQHGQGINRKELKERKEKTILQVPRSTGLVDGAINFCERLQEDDG
jgi:hypothetical protein